MSARAVPFQAHPARSRDAVPCDPAGADAPEPTDQRLEQVAMLGLCKAVRGFQPDRGVSFAAYAVPTIVGELERHCRDAGWLVRPTRSRHEFGRFMRAAEGSLVQRTGRHPSAVDVARFLDVPVQQVDRARPAERGFWGGSLDSLETTSGQPFGATLADPHDDFELVEAALLVGPAMAALTPGSAVSCRCASSRE